MFADAYLIGLTGPSGSGKSYLARHLAAKLNALVLSTDAYYHDLSHISLQRRAESNFDNPIALDHELLIAHLSRLRRGEGVEIPTYDFASHTRVAQSAIFGPAEIVIIEGLFALYWPELRNLLGTKVYVDMNDDVCLARRTERDVRERGRTLESVQQQYAKTVAPMAHRFVVPTKAHADVVVSGAAPIADSVTRIMEHVRGNRNIPHLQELSLPA